MTRHLNSVAAFVLLLVPPAALADGGGNCVPSNPTEGIALLIGDRLMVRTLPGVELDSFVTAFQADWPEITLAPLEAIPGRPIHLLDFEVPPGTDMQAVENALETAYTALIAWAEPLYTNEAPEGHTGSTFVDGPASASLYGSQYLGTQIGLDAAQAQSSGLGIVVALLDTGLDATHPALAGQVAPGGWNFVDGNADTSDVGDGLDNDGDGETDELTGHGTFVAGLVARTAPGALLLPVRVLDTDGGGDGWTLAQGLFFAIDRGVEVINVSLGSTYDSEAVEDAIDEAAALGIVTVSAAGNLDRCEPREYPAMKSTGIGVAALDHTDHKADFSNYSDKLVISAPGDTAFDGADPVLEQSIVSTIPGGGYAIWEGTSFAVPLVSGTAALVRAQHPEWPPDFSTSLSLEAVLATGAVPIDALNAPYAGQLGAGRLNAANAVSLGPPAPTLGDLDNSGAVDVNDLVQLIVDWGLVHSSADLDGDGTVDVDDLAMLIVNWG